MTRLQLEHADAVGIRADNPGPLTLSGTNTWIVGRGPAWLIDPGPALDRHLDALAAELTARGGLGGVALTHAHHDHSEGLEALLARSGPAPVAAHQDAVVELRDGDSFGPFEAQELPGHAPDHLVYLWDGVAFTGDAVLGEGSVFIAPDPGALAGYLHGLERLAARHPRLIAPGHGPVVPDPAAKIAEYISHRLAREAALLEALAGGARTVDQLLDAAWAEVPEQLRFAAAITLTAHLDKLEDEGRLPRGVERPPGWPL